MSQFFKVLYGMDKLNRRLFRGVGHPHFYVELNKYDSRLVCGYDVGETCVRVSTMWSSIEARRDGVRSEITVGDVDSCGCL